MLIRSATEVAGVDADWSVLGVSVALLLYSVLGLWPVPLVG